MVEPLYTAATCKVAYQLDWAYCAFWHRLPSDDSWFEQLKALNETDHIRLLQHRFDKQDVSKFLVSTQPQVPPLLVAQRVKGRLQWLIRDRLPDAFQRNYSLSSIGSTKRDKLDRYLQTQLDHHPMADPNVQARLKKYQVACPEVDLSKARHTSHAQYWYNLHVVMAHVERYMEIRDTTLGRMRDMILQASAARGDLLSRAAILPDHIHLALGCQLNESPEQVALSYMNNLAYACDMKPVFRHSYFVGTFGEYDLGAIPRL
jgi:REP element-mobilizing transposase RayT